MDQILRNRISLSFPNPIVFIGTLTLVFSILIIIKYPLVSFFLFMMGLFLSTSSYGTEIDLSDGKFRSYARYFGFKTGKWNQLNTMSCIAVLLSQNGYRAYGRSNQSTSLSQIKYDVCLLSKSHRERFVIQKFKTKDEAVVYAQKLEILLGFNLTTFNPTISQKTSNRRKNSN